MEENMSAVAEEAVGATADAAAAAAASTLTAESEIPAKKRRKPINQQKLQDNLWGWAFCVPLIVGTVLFIYVALFMAILLSFTTYNGGQGVTMWEFLGAMFSGGTVGTGFNQVDVFTNPANMDYDPFRWYKYVFTWTAHSSDLAAQSQMSEINVTGALLFNTVFYAIGIPIGMVLSMFFAVCMSRDIKGGNVFRVIYYIPCVASTVSIVYTFRLMFGSTPNSVINQLLGTAVPWMGPGGSEVPAVVADGVDPFWTQGIVQKCLILIMSIWKGLGGTIILYIAGLSGVNASTKEAAQIDGASGWRIFWRITMPDLYPVIFYNMVTAIIGGMQIYAEPELFFPTETEGPNIYTSGYVSLIWWYGVSNTGHLFEAGGSTSSDIYSDGGMGSRAWYGLGAAYGIVLAIIVLVLTLVQFWLDKRNQD